MRFQSKNAVLKFLRRCVKGKHLMRFKFLLSIVYGTLKPFKELGGSDANCCLLADNMKNCTL